MVDASMNMVSGYPVSSRSAGVSGGEESGRDDFFFDDVRDPELNRPPGEAERLGEQEDDRGRSPAHDVTGEGV